LLPLHRLDPQPYVASVMISSDGGATWRRGADVSTPGQIGAAEPSIAQLADGSLLMSLRVSDGRIWLARSSDLGRTWSDPERTELVAAASSSNVFCTTGARLLLTYNSSAPERTELSMVESVDGGRSWSRPLSLAEIAAPTDDDEVYSRQVCYPSVCELDDGALRVVWAEIEVSPKLQSGIIQSARVRLSGGSDP